MGRNGKSSLIKEIQEYIGKEHILDTLHLEHHLEDQTFLLNKKISYICGIDTWNQKEDILLLQKLLANNKSIIADTNKIFKINSFILENAIIIDMNHIFPL